MTHYQRLGYFPEFDGSVKPRSPFRERVRKRQLFFLRHYKWPVRQGLVSYGMSDDVEHGAGGGGTAFVGIQGLGCLSSLCGGCGAFGSLVPFTLGGPFDIGGSTSGETDQIDITSGGGEITIMMQLFELDGTPVAIFDAAPEPSTWLLAALGLMALAVFRTKAVHAASRL